MAQILLYPLKLIAITADTADHGYNAYDFGWTDDDGSGDLGPNCWLRACADGIVTQIINTHPDYPDDQGYGNYIVIAYPEAGYTSLFAHIKRDSFVVKVGDRVKQRQRVCRQDNSGYSFGPHLHMEICKGQTFTRHGGVDYIAQGIIYADDWNIVRPETQREYNIRHVAIQPTIQDISKTQVRVDCTDLNVRKGPSTTAQIAGTALPGYYDVELISETPDITWANVAGTDYWVAANLPGDTELLEASFVPTEPDETKDQVEVQIDDLRIRQEPSTTARILGFAPVGFYDVEGTEAGADFVWIKTCGAWIACVDGVIYHAAQEDEKDKRIKELEAEVAFLEQRLSETEDALHTAAERITDLTATVAAQVKDLQAIAEIAGGYTAA